MASKIVSVDAGSPAERAGIRAGETLLMIDLSLIHILGKTHLCAGVCAGTAFALWADLPLAQAGIAAAAGLIGGVIPDLDHRKSKVTQKTGLFGFFSSHLLKQMCIRDRCSGRTAWSGRHSS